MAAMRWPAVRRHYSRHPGRVPGRTRQAASCSNQTGGRASVNARSAMCGLGHDDRRRALDADGGPDAALLRRVLPVAASADTAAAQLRLIRQCRALHPPLVADGQQCGGQRGIFEDANELGLSAEYEAILASVLGT